MCAESTRRYMVLLLDLETQALRTFALVSAAGGEQAMRQGLPRVVHEAISMGEAGASPTGLPEVPSLVVVSLRVFDADSGRARTASREPATWICFHLARPSEVALAIHDCRGRRVRDLGSGPRAGGDHAVVWDGRDDAGGPVRQGVYDLRFVVGGCRLSRRLVVSPPVD